MAANPLTIAAGFVRLALARADAQQCVDQSLAEMKAAGIDESTAITMLSTALVSSAMNDASDHENLFHGFIELEERKKGPGSD